MRPKARIIVGDCLDEMRRLPEQSFHCCVTSPPYWGVRDYDHDAQIGLEKTPEDYLEVLLDVFRDVRDVLRDDGTLWIVMGDTYVKKCQLGLPWRLALALQEDGWYLRQDIIWHKPNPMPENVSDRCTRAHDYIFLLAKSSRYYYDADAVREDGAEPNRVRSDRVGGSKGHLVAGRHSPGGVVGTSLTRNRRSVWSVVPKPVPGSKCPTYPPALIAPCILAGCPPGGSVLDPFGGSGTTSVTALMLGRSSTMIELNPEYAALAQERVSSELDRAQFSMFQEEGDE